MTPLWSAFSAAPRRDVEDPRPLDGRTIHRTSESMAARKITLEESIARLAKETGASESFVEKVRALFLGRGIDLEDSSEPYTHALADAFRRHASLRQQFDDARASLVKLHANLADLGDAFH